MAVQATLNRRVQFGAEVTPGTNVSAGKYLECFNVTMGPKVAVKVNRSSGRRWANTAEENQEWSEAKIAADSLDYQGMTYLVAGAWGVVSPVTHAGGTLSKDWVWTPPVTGAITPQTYTIEQGDAVRAQKLNYGLITSFGYKVTRMDTSCNASLVGQLLQDSITITTSPTAVALAPVAGKHINVYIDNTSGGLGVTLFTLPFSLEYAYDSGFGTYWALNRANTSFTGHVDTQPKNTVKLTVGADTQGMSLMGNLQAGSTIYMRVDILGNIIENTIHYEMKHDMALKVIDVGDFADDQGVNVIPYTCEVVEDTAWSSGQSQVLTLTNLLTAL